MKLDHNVYGQLTINGVVIHKDESIRMSQVIQHMMKLIIEHDIETRNFSTLSIQISKRPIVD